MIDDGCSASAHATALVWRVAQLWQVLPNREHLSDAGQQPLVLQNPQCLHRHVAGWERLTGEQLCEVQDCSLLLIIELALCESLVQESEEVWRLALLRREGVPPFDVLFIDDSLLKEGVVTAI